MPEAVPERAAANVSLGNLSTRRRHHMNSDQIKETVKQKYGHVAQRVLGGERGDCGCACDPVSSNLYDVTETATSYRFELTGSQAQPQSPRSNLYDVAETAALPEGAVR